MVTLKEAKTAAGRKKILVSVCEEFKEIFGDELDPPIVTKGKTEKDLTTVLTEIGKDALEIGDNISEQSEGIMLELEILSKAYLKAMKKREGAGDSEKGKKASKEKAAAPEPEPEKKLSKKEKKAEKAAKEKAAKEKAAAPEPEKKLSKKEKKAEKKEAEKKAAKDEKAKQPVIKYSRYDAVADVIAKVGDFKNLDDLVQQSNDRYVKKTGKPANDNEAKLAARNIIMVLSHFPKVKFSVGE